MKVRRAEGVANHSGPESCVGAREGAGEALTGVRAGWPLSRESKLSRMPTRCHQWKATRMGALLRAPGRSGVVVEASMCGSSLRGNRESLGLAGRAPPVRAGKARSRSR